MRFRAINFACVLVALAVVVHVVPAANAAAIAPTLVKRILVKRDEVAPIPEPEPLPDPTDTPAPIPTTPAVPKPTATPKDNTTTPEDPDQPSDGNGTSLPTWLIGTIAGSVAGALILSCLLAACIVRHKGRKQRKKLRQKSSPSESSVTTYQRPSNHVPLPPPTPPTMLRYARPTPLQPPRPFIPTAAYHSQVPIGAHHPNSFHVR